MFRKEPYCVVRNKERDGLSKTTLGLSLLLSICVCMAANVRAFAYEVSVDDKKVSLILGDTQSAATLGAIHELRNDPDTKHYVVRLFVKGNLTSQDREFIETSSVLIVYPRFAGLVRDVLPQTERAREAGALVLGVGATIEPEFTEKGISRDPQVSTYFEAGGVRNLVQMVRCAINRRKGKSLELQEPQAWPDYAYFSPKTGLASVDFDSYEQAQASLMGESNFEHKRRRVGILFSRETAVGGDIETLGSLDKKLRDKGLVPIFAYGYPGDQAVEQLFLDKQGESRVEAVIALTLKIGNVPEKIVPILERVNVPVINAIALNSQNFEQWKGSMTGLDLIERSWQVGAAELAGAISPTVIATRETVVDSSTGQNFALTMPIEERVSRLTDRIEAWVRLRTIENEKKRVALVYYNYPPGRESIGASYLNVMPDSLHAIIEKLRDNKFDLGECPEAAKDLFDVVHAYGSNPSPGDGARREIQRMVESKRVQLLPVKKYREWFDQLPDSFRQTVLKQWGEPEQSEVMTWKDDLGESYFVFPVLRYGNILLGPQPTRGWHHDIEAVYHDITLPPHHQYIAFYLWLQYEFGADACVHVGTHATHEWLPGREVGFDEQDAGEIVVGSIPQLYLYIVDDVGEGLQAKRRGMATMISHQTPPLDRASLSSDLREISALITDYGIASGKGSQAAAGLLRDITQRSSEKGLLKELSIEIGANSVLDEEQIELVEHHLKRIGERLTPFGMHAFGSTLTGEAKKSTIDAILSVEGDLTPELRSSREVEIGNRIDRSGAGEWESLFRGLNGQYVPSGPGGDPIRNSDVLPTGKNFYGFDPARMPSAATYEVGSDLAKAFLEDYARKHSGASPTRLVFNLWGTESSRHEGTIEAQILALMGVRPIWDSRGRVQDVELISREELGRPRVDITIVPSGLYRDLFSKLMLLMDRAVDVVQQDLSDDNPILQNIRYTTEELIREGVEPGLAKRLATVRLFSLPSGAYGAGLEHVIQAEKTWKDEQEINAVFMNRMSHMFGQGFWGTRAGNGESGADLSPMILREAFKGATGVIHSRSSNVYGAVDSDDFYQYLGGTTMAIREANGGKSVDAYVADLSNPRQSEVVSLQQYVGQEMRARYFNPKWIEAMTNEGYAGSRMIRQMTDNLWGWQVTVPEAVGDSKWQEMYEVYVEDRHGLDIRQKFSDAGNVAAYAAMLERMKSVIEKGYWNAAPEVKEKLNRTLLEVQPGVASEQKSVQERADLQPAPSAIALDVAKPIADSKAASGGSTRQLLEMVQGFAMQTERQDNAQGNESKNETKTKSSDWVKVIFVLSGVFFLILNGWFRKPQRLFE